MLSATFPLNQGPACVQLLASLVSEAPPGQFSEGNRPHETLLRDHVTGLDPRRGGLGAYLPLQPLAEKALAGSIRTRDYFDLYQLALAVNFARGLPGTEALLVGSREVYRHAGLSTDAEASPIAGCAVALRSPVAAWANVFPYWWEIFEAGGLFLGDQGRVWEVQGDRLTVWIDNLSHWQSTLHHRQDERFGVDGEERLHLEISGKATADDVEKAQIQGRQIVSLMTEPTLSDDFGIVIDMLLYALHDGVYHASTKARLGRSRLREVLFLGKALLREPQIAGNPVLNKVAMNLMEAAHIYIHDMRQPVVHVFDSAVRGMELMSMFARLTSEDDHQARRYFIALILAANRLLREHRIPLEIAHQVSVAARGDTTLPTEYLLEGEDLPFFSALRAAGLPVEITFA